MTSQPSSQSSVPFPLNITDSTLRPVYRRLRAYAFDPSFATQLDSYGINTVVYSIRWEDLSPGPIGEYVEVIDIDPPSSVFYPPIDLDDPRLLAQDGLPPSESNPQFHQQMVYAVAMLTIQNFEKALGRPVQWSSEEYKKENTDEKGVTHKAEPEKYVQRLRLYPHALRDANAYYSNVKKAVLFGYFSARPRKVNLLMPGSLVFSCLSHDIITHEVTHALIDGIYKRYVIPYNEDTLALHEGFADLVALFQHFSFPEILESQIGKTKGELTGPQLLSQLAQQFGLAIGQYSSLRDAIGNTEDGKWKATEPNPQELAMQKEPHGRGSILVAAVFDAFLNIYKRRTADLYRIASDGTGVMRAGELHPDLVRRLAEEASRAARQFLSLCIRALDYCPPVGVTFGELLRAMVTADVDLVPNDPFGYRVALVESFKRWGIYPIGIRTLSVENLVYYAYSENEIVEFSRIGNETSDVGKPPLPNDQVPLRTRFERILNDLIEESRFLEFDYTLKDPSKEANAKEVYKRFRTLLTKGSHPLPKLPPMVKAVQDLKDLVWHFYNDTTSFLNRRDILFELSLDYKRRLHRFINDLDEDVKRTFQDLTGILLCKGDYLAFCKESMKKLNYHLGMLANDAPSPIAISDIRMDSWDKNDPAHQQLKFEVHSLNRAQRVGPDANVLNHVIMTLMQRCLIDLTDGRTYEFRGGCTMVMDVDQKTVRFIRKGILNPFEQLIDYTRLADELLRRYRTDQTEGESAFAMTSWPAKLDNYEFFALLHTHA